ncbi:hypothetical protein ACTMU2_27610 [Cupriavidus basilensis]
MHKGLDALRKMLSEEPRLLPEPKPRRWWSTTPQGITLNLRSWTSSGDYWAVRYTFYERIKHVLEDAGCKIAVPIQEVHYARPRCHAGEHATGGSTPIRAPTRCAVRASAFRQSSGIFVREQCACPRTPPR